MDERDIKIARLETLLMVFGVGFLASAGVLIDLVINHYGCF